MPIKVKKCFIDGLLEIQPAVYEDNRGYFFEAYNQNDFIRAGLNLNFVQDNQSKSYKNVVRGLHFQKKYPQGKLIRVLDGSVYDIAVDLRSDSKTFGKYFGLILDSEKHNLFYIPEGFAHGFCVLSESAVFSYKNTDFYHPEDEGAIIWNDPIIGIDWESVLPGITSNAVLGERDKKNPFFNPEQEYFDSNGKWLNN